MHSNIYIVLRPKILCVDLPRIVFAPFNLQPELRSTLTFIISWQHDRHVTLTLHQTIPGTIDTRDLLNVNNTTTEILDGAWKTYADVVITNNIKMTNGMEKVTLNVTLRDITIDAEGEYVIQLSDSFNSSEVTYSQINFRIKTFGNYSLMNKSSNLLNSKLYFKIE